MIICKDVIDFIVVRTQGLVAMVYVIVMLPPLRKRQCLAVGLSVTLPHC